MSLLAPSTNDPIDYWSLYIPGGQCSKRGAFLAAVKAAIGQNVDVNAQIDNNGVKYTLLHIAAANGDVDAIRLLLAHGVDVEAEHFNQYSGPERPLQLAAGSGKAEAVSLLLDAGADIHAEAIEGGRGATALDMVLHGLERRVVRQGHVDTIHLLLDRGLDVNGRNMRGVYNPEDGTVVSPAPIP